MQYLANLFERDLTGERAMDVEAFSHLHGDLLQSAYDLRLAVFCDEQGVPVCEERDAWDETACHVGLVTAAAGGRRPTLIATGRVRLVEASLEVAKVERVAVHAAYRGTGMGRRLMVALEEQAGKAGARVIKLAAQDVAIPFYLQLGYVAQGAEFLDAGIVHRWMTRKLVV